MQYLALSTRIRGLNFRRQDTTAKKIQETINMKMHHHLQPHDKPLFLTHHHQRLDLHNNTLPTVKRIVVVMMTRSKARNMTLKGKP